MKELKTLLFVVLAAVFFIGLFIMSDRFADDVHSEYASFISGPSSGGNLASSAEPVSPEDLALEKWIVASAEDAFAVEVNLTAAGDIFCQDVQLEYAYDAETDSFDFSQSFRYLGEMLQDSDFIAATLKTTFAGAGNGYYPYFYGYDASDSVYNSPDAFAAALKNCGISLLNTAGNHSLDSGEQGLFSTIDCLNGLGIAHTGTAKEASDSKDYILNQSGLRIAFTGWTNLTNEMTLPEEYSYALNDLNNYSSSRVKEMCDHVTQLKKENDFVVVMLNFGSAFSTSIESDQRTVSGKLAKAGADLILGTGSMAVKPMEMLAYTGDDGFQHTCPVFYGLGDLISSESYYDNDGLPVDFGMLVKLHIRRQLSGSVSLAAFDVYPVYINWTDDQIQPIPALGAGTDPRFQDLLTEDDLIRLENGPQELMENLVGEADLTYLQEQDHFQVKLP